MHEEGYTLIDYMRFRQDIPFSIDPVNDVDNIIFSTIAYISFRDLLEPMVPHTGITLKDSTSCRVDVSDDEFEVRRSKDFVLAAESKRYQDIELGYYCEMIDHEKSLQFSAITFHINDHLSYVAFQGTGNTIVGWKEDFMISFTRIGAQKMAEDYLNKVINLEEDRQYIIGGHSKGGNLAVYASACLSKEKQDRIVKIYCNDGPGICSDVMDPSIVDSIRDKVICIQPGYCVIGKLFDMHYENTIIIKSYEKGLDQHDPSTWMVNGPHIYELDSYEPASLWLSKVFGTWIEGVDTLEARKEFVDGLFGSFMAGGAVTVEDITKEGVEQVVKAMMNTSDTAKEVGFALPKTAIKVGAEMMGESLNESFKRMQENATITKEKIKENANLTKEQLVKRKKGTN